MNTAEQGQFCSACGARLAPGDAFCQNCGRPTSQPVNAGYAPSQQIPTGAYGPGGSQQAPVVAQQYMPQDGYTMYTPSQPSAPSRRNTPRKNTGSILAVFAVLAILVVLLFVLMKLPFLAVIIGVAAVAVCCVVRLLLVARNFLASLGLWLSAVVLCFVVLMIFVPGGKTPAGTPVTAMSTDVAPSSADTTVAYGKISIVIPGDTVQNKEKLSVTPVSSLPPPIAGLEPVCPALDVKLGELKTFKKPIFIDIPYDSKKLGNVPPEKGFIAVYYDEALKIWVDVPFEVNKEKSVVRLKMSHLTTVQLDYSWITGWYTYTDRDITVMYKNTPDQQKSFADYEKKTGKTPGTSGAPCYVADLAVMAQMVYGGYRAENLKLPDSVTLYISDSGDSVYKGLTGNVVIPADLGSKDNPLEHMQRDIGHELFHMAQDYTLGWFDYTATQKKNISFWLEATADYMGNTGIWEIMKQTGKTQVNPNYGPVNRYQKYKLDFFEKNLYTMDGFHEYQAAHFVKYLQSQKPAASAAKLVDMCESYSSFPTAFAAAYSAKSLEAYYRDFLLYSLSQSTPSFDEQVNGMLEIGVSNKVPLSFTLDKNGKGTETKPLEGSAALTFSGDYTAGFCVFKSNCDTTITVKPAADVILLRYTRLLKDLKYDLRVDAPGGKETQINFGKDTFVLALQVSPKAGSISMAYKALPTQTDISGRWNFTQLVLTDVEAGDAFWAAVKSDYGYDKGSYINLVNEKVPAQLPNLYLQLTKTAAAGQYTMTLSFAGSTVDFGTITVNNNAISASAKVGELWTSIALTVSGNQITGKFRAQATYTKGDKVLSATEVYQLTAAHDKPSA